MDVIRREESPAAAAPAGCVQSKGSIGWKKKKHQLLLHTATLYSFLPLAVFLLLFEKRTGWSEGASEGAKG